MKAKYINPFINATMNLFKDYLGLEVKSGTPIVLEDPQALDEVSGIIGLAGETTGSVVLSFSKDTAIKIISKFAGHPYQALGSEVLDGVGELINIVAGNAKKDLLDFKIVISLPGVITGNDYRIHWPEQVPVISVPFITSAGDFTLNVSLKDA
ncbi:MAG: chemotaxis protein CheX [Spirochaetia bacterium]|jgi:chemotaxis protein CheX|nr:chemotaxis protein CheX [Spirochaetia bacterium]